VNIKIHLSNMDGSSTSSFLKAQV